MSPSAHLAEVSAREIREWDVNILGLHRMWYAEVIRPMAESLIDNAYHQGILPLPPLNIGGDGVWTRKEPWYVAVDG